MNPLTAASSATDRSAVEEFASDIAYYLSLTPRQLPSRYLYDDLGSVLFDAICRLPWYPITRAETRLLAAHGKEIFGCLPALANIVELGPGNGEKLRLLLDASTPRRAGLTVHLVDVSASALAAAATIIGGQDGTQVVTHQATYDEGLRSATAGTEGHTLVTFLGSNIGNFDPPGAAEFLHDLRTSLNKDDGLLIGVDLVKPQERFDLLPQGRVAAAGICQKGDSLRPLALERGDEEILGTFVQRRHAFRGPGPHPSRPVEFTQHRLVTPAVSTASIDGTSAAGRGCGLPWVSAR